jgi:Bacterial Ig-like domain (group 3)
MLLQRDKGIGSPAQFNTGLPPVQTTEEVPRWLAIFGLTAALTLLVALLRYAIDLLGVVFLIIFVGFSIRTISDWLTEGESVSTWALGAVISGLAGTTFVVIWLFGSNSALEGIESRLPTPVRASVGWLESHGWGQRVLLTERAGGFRSGVQLARGGSGGGAPTLAAPPSGPGIELPSLRSGDRRKKSGTKDDDIGTAEASELERRSSAAGEQRSRTRGLTSGTQAGNDVRPAANVETFTTIVTSRPSTVVGTLVKLTAFVTTASGSKSPSGVVVFQRDGVVLGTATLRGGPDGSTASLTITSLPIGDHDIVAYYPGDPGFSASYSPTVRQIVARR